jgi:hypothetical protein
MDCLSNEADSMPPSGHPIREVRLTPWVPIQAARTERQNRYRARRNSPLLISCIYHDGWKDLARRHTLEAIKYSYLHGL